MAQAGLVQLSSTKKFDICVAIDFGTDGTGVAVATQNTLDTDDIIIIGLGADRLTKEKTNLLLNDKHEFVAFGTRALTEYTKYQQSQNEENDDNVDSDDSLLFFERFKMKLYDREIASSVLSIEDNKENKENEENEEMFIQIHEMKSWSDVKTCQWLKQELMANNGNNNNNNNNKNKMDNLTKDMIDQFVKLTEKYRFNGKTMITISNHLKHSERKSFIDLINIFDKIDSNCNKNKLSEIKQFISERLESSLKKIVKTKSISRQSIKRKIEAADGQRKCDTDIVFIESLKYIKDCVMAKIIEERGFGFVNVTSPSDIQWIVTVPAIWNDASKALMSTWCQKAGLIDLPNQKTKWDNHLQIVYEPECASICLRNEIQKEINQINKNNNDNNNDNNENKEEKKDESIEMNENNNSAYKPSINAESKPSSIAEQFQNGERYILIDAGGGTCDIACHEIVGQFCIAQCYQPTGGPWGSTAIDTNFFAILKYLFKSQKIKEFQQTHPACFVNLKREFVKQKESYLKRQYKEFCKIKGNLNGKFDRCDFLRLIFDKNENKEKNKNNAIYGGFDEFIKEMRNEKIKVDLPPELVDFLIDKQIESEKRQRRQLNQQMANKNENGKKNNDDDGYGTDNSDTSEYRYEIQDMLEEKVGKKTNNTIEMKEGSLMISHEAWKLYLLDPVIEPIIKHIKGLLTDALINDSKNKFKYLCLVGGFSQSIYLQSRIQQEFGKNSNDVNENEFGLAIKMPRNPLLCVVEGAARLGLRPDYVQRRFLSKTYGIAVDREINAIKQIQDKLPKDFINKYKYVHKFTHNVCVRNLFSAFIRRGESINIDDKPIQRKYKRFHSNEPKIQIQIYCSDLYEPYVTTDDYYFDKKNRHNSNKSDDDIARTQLLGTAYIEFADECDELAFLVNFHFGETQIKVTAEIGGQSTPVDLKFNYD